LIKLTPLVFLCVLTLVTPAFADDTPNSVASDVGAIQKDNQSLNKTHTALSKDRAKKAQDKANSNKGGQAIDSLNIGKDKADESEKETETATDKKILNNDVNGASDK